MTVDGAPGLPVAVELSLYRIAREALTWNPEELAKRLNEKKSVVLKIESGGFHPPDALVRKLEHLLKVRLRAEPEATLPE